MSQEKFPTVVMSPIGGETIQTVDARALHGFLCVGKKFADWIRERIEAYGFNEGTDFVTFSQNGEKGRPTIEYALSIDMAKELSMVERNEQGKRARQYFIDCERLAKDPQRALNHVPTLRQLLLDNVEKVIALEERVAELQPAQEALDRISLSDGSLCITDAAKALQMRPKDLFTFLDQNGWTYRRPGTTARLGYQSKVTSGLLEHKVTTVSRADGSEKITEQVRVTPKGLSKLASLIQPALRAAS